MRYMGSKKRLAKYLVPVLMKEHNNGLPYIEPFVGGGNMIQHIPAEIRRGADIDRDGIALLYGLAHGWLPPESLSEVEYQAIKAAPENYPGPLVGFAKFCCSFGGKAWGGYARAAGRDMINEQHRALLLEAPRLRGCSFTTATYLALNYPDGCTVYCDPPYQGSTGYQATFDHAEFWSFFEGISKRCRVFVSEYSAPPPGWVPIWEKSSKANFDSGRSGGLDRTERLYIYEGN